MFLALRFRTDRGRGRDGPEIYVKAGFVWFEGVNDLHIQFDGPGEDNYRPGVKEEDYFAPHPETGRMTALYSLEVGYKVPAGCKRAPKGYVEKLKAKWENMNG